MDCGWATSRVLRQPHLTRDLCRIVEHLLGAEKSVLPPLLACWHVSPDRPRLPGVHVAQHLALAAHDVIEQLRQFDGALGYIAETLGSPQAAAVLLDVFEDCIAITSFSLGTGEQEDSPAQVLAP